MRSKDIARPRNHMFFYFPFQLLHLRAAHLAILAVHQRFVDRGETDEDVDRVSEHSPRAENRADQVPTESEQEPVQSSDDQQDERYDMDCFH